MKFSMNRSVFLNKLKDVIYAVSTRTPIPILTGLKLEVSNDGIKLTGSNAEISIESYIFEDDEDAGLEIESTGAAVLQPATFFQNIVSKLPGDRFSVVLNEHASATISAKDATFDIRVVDADQYPLLPQMDTDQSFDLPVRSLKQVIQQTIIAVSPHESRPILTGIQFTIRDGELKAVATDSHRLAQRVVALDEVKDLDYQMVIPGQSLTELSKILTDDIENVTVSIAENQILFQTDDTNFYSRLLEGKYPETDQLISDEYSTAITVDIKDLLGAVDRASIIASQGHNNLVTLNILEDSLEINGKSPEIGIVEEEIPFIDIEGEDLEISFNPDYLRDALKTFVGSEVLIRFTGALRTFMILPADTEKARQFIQLITPIRTR